MGTTATTKSDFKPAPDGTHPATCTQVIDLGHQAVEWEGVQKLAHKILLGWELDTDEKRDDGSPFVVFRRFTLTLGKKGNLRPLLEAWRGVAFTEDELAAFDVKNLLGKPCMVSIIHARNDGNTYANVSSVTSLPKKMPAPTVKSEKIYFNLDEPDMAVMGKFSPKLQATIKESNEWLARHGKPAPEEHEPAPMSEDQVPF